MKRKYLLIPILISPLLLSSCSFSDVIDINPIAKVEIEDSNTQYACGDVYSQEQELSILVTYKSNSRAPEYLSINDVEFTFTVDNVEQDYTSPIASGAQSLSVYVTYNKIKSNTLTYDLLSEHVYVEHLSISGANKANTFEETNLALSIIPSNYTKKVVVSASDSSMADVSRDGNNIKVIGKKPGEVDIIASSVNASGSEVKAIHHMTFIAETNMVTAKQTYNDFVKNNIYNISACPLSGNPKLLVIPVWFTDSNKFINTTKKDDVKEDIEKVYFGTTVETGWYSVSSYYKEESKGNLELTGTVSDWYEPGLSYLSLATDPAKDNVSLPKTSDLVNKAVDWYFRTTGDNRSDYDSDGDKILDGVMLIYAAPDHQVLESKGEEGDYSNLWAYCFWLQPTPGSLTIQPNVFFWASYDFMYGNNAVQRTGKSYGNGKTTSTCIIDAHTYIHEMGHVFGLEDYYDYSDYGYTPAGMFSMQDYNIGGHDPFSVFAFGWASAYVPTSSDTITISNFQDNHDLILLTPEFNSYSSPFDEYLLLELFTPTGLNAFDSKNAYFELNGRPYYGPNDVGIRLWHVDARLAICKDSVGTNYDLTESNVKQSAPFGITHACSNTYNDRDNEKRDYLSKLGSKYYDYNILQFIRNDRFENYTPVDAMDSADLFYKGDTFTMSDYYRQFVGGTKLNNGKDLGWSFTVKDIALVNGQYTATIQVNKL